MRLTKTLIPTVALATLAATPALADVTTADNLVCTPSRMARCGDDGQCQWKTASDRNKARPLIVDFKTKQAFVRRGGKDRPIGSVLEDRVEDGARRVVISRDATRPPNKTLDLSIDTAGKLTGSRSGGRIRFEATCAET